MKATIQPGYGYWDCTQYPIGGKFCRAPKDAGVEVEIIEVLDRPSHGCNRVGITADGRKVAFDSRYTDTKA